MGKFQSLRGVDRHHHHGVVPFTVLLQIGVQGDLLQEACQAGLHGIGHIGVNAGFQFADVFQPGFVLLCGFAGQHIRIAGADQQLVVEFRQAHSVFQQLGKALNQGAEL